MGAQTPYVTANGVRNGLRVSVPAASTIGGYGGVGGGGGGGSGGGGGQT